jgi:hypothetical protein
VQTLLLDVVSWDLTVDLSGNIAVASNPYSLAQDAASAIKTFKGECWYDTSLGVNYWGQVLGKFPPLSLLKADFVNAATTVPEVTSATAYISGVSDNRVLSGQVQVFDANGRSSVASFFQPVDPNAVVYPGQTPVLTTDVGAVLTTEGGQPLLVT